MRFRSSVRAFLPLLTLGACTAVMGVFLWSLQNPVSLDDGLRHVVMGRTMAGEGILEAGGWDRWFFAGVLADQPADPWFLSDVLYIPFASFDTVVALKIIALGTFVLIGGVFLFCLSSLGVGSIASSVLLLALLYGYDSFTYRLMLGRPFPIITILSLLLILCIVKKRPIIAAILLCLLTLLSHLFVFAVGIAVVGCIWLWWSKKRNDALRLGAAIIIGVLAGIAFHPEIVGYLAYLSQTFFRIPFLSLKERGGEMMSGFGVSGPIYLALLVGGLTGMKRVKDKTLPNASILLGVLSFLFLLQFFAWVRSIDFLWPILLLFVGSTLSDHGKALERFLQEFVPRPKRLLVPVMGILLLFTILSFGFVAKNVHAGDASRSLVTYENALKNIEPGSRVFNLEWQMFTPSLTARSDVLYAQGIDPAFTYLEDPYASKFIQPPDAPSDEELDAWMAEISATYSADYLFFRTSKYPEVFDFLEKEGYEDVSMDDTFAVFSL